MLLSAGTLELKGDMTVIGYYWTPGFYASNTNKVTLSGEELQTISVGESDAAFSRIEINNESNEGVIFKDYLKVITLETNGNRTKFESAKVQGWTLDHDIVIEGDFHLDSGTLDLNGYKLKINGNFDLYDGKVIINQGELDIQGNYSQTGGAFVMDQEEDYVLINGDLYHKTQYSKTMLLSAGTLELKGNITVVGYYWSPGFYASNTHTTVLSGSEKQEISIGESDSHFATLILANTSQEGVEFVTDIYAETLVNEQTNLQSQGNIKGWTLDRNTVISGDLKLSGGELNLNGYDLVIEGNLIQTGGSININAGQLFVEEDYSQTAGTLVMDSDADYMCVENRFYVKNQYSKTINLSAGILELKGDFELVGYYWSPTLIASGTHKTILSGQECQTITIGESDSLLNDLYLTKEIDSGYAFNRKSISHTVTEKNDDQEAPTSVSNLQYEMQDETELKLSWEAASDNLGILGYEIIRNGTVLGFTRRNYFIDDTITSSQKYTYVVKAYDLVKNASEDNATIEVNTLIDTEKPTAPKQLKITERSTDSITLHWESATDNIRVAGYYVYRNGKLIATTGARSAHFTDLAVAPGLYVYSVTAFDDDGNESYISNYVTYDNAPPAKPVLVVDDITTTGVTLRWSECEDNFKLEGYVLYRDGVRIAKLTENQYIDSGLKDSTQYTYTLVAYDTSGNYSEASDPIIIYTYEDTEAPTCPGNIKVDSYSKDGVNLSWNSASDNIGVCYYRVYRDGELIGNTQNCEYNDKTIEEGIDYSYQVSAVDGSGNESELSQALFVPYIETDVDEENSSLLSVILNKQNEMEELGIENLRISWTTKDYVEKSGWLVEATDSNLEESEPVTMISIDYYKDGTSRHENYCIWSSGNSCKGNCKENEFGEICILSANGNVLQNAIKRSNQYFLSAPADGYSIFITLPEISNIAYGSSGRIGTDGKEVDSPIAIRKLILGKLTDYSIKLEWAKPNTSLPITGYIVFCNGQKIAQISEDYFVDTEIEQQKIYSYYVVVLYDESIESEKSNIVTTAVITPYLSKVEPANQSIIGGNEVTLNFEYITNYSAKDCQLLVEYGHNGEYKKLEQENIVATDMDGGIKYTVNWNLQNILSGSYEVRLSIVDEEKTHIIKSLQYVINTDIPGSIKTISAEAGESQINLLWDEVHDENVKYYVIYRALEEDGEYSCIAKLNAAEVNSYIDKDVEVGKEYFYKIVTESEFGKQSAASDIVSAVALADTTPPVILGFLPQSLSKVGKYVSITVKTTDNVGIKDITLQYLNLQNEWIDIDTIEGKEEAVFKFENPIEKGELKVRAVVTDTSNNTANNNAERTYLVASAEIQGINITDLEIASTDVVIKWEAIKAEDFSHFLVYVKNDESGEIVKSINTGNVLGTTVTGLVPNEKYHLQVVAYDTWENEIGESKDIKITTESDTESPIIQTINSLGNRFNKLINVTIKAEDNYKLDSLSFQYSLDKCNWVEFSKQLLPQTREAEVTSTLNLDEFAEGSIFVRGVATDVYGNISNGEQGVEFVEYIVDRTPPKAPIGVSVEETIQGISLTWLQGEEPDIASYNVYTFDSELNEFVQTATGLQTLYYIESNAVPSKLYRYKVTCKDSAGNESEFSKEVQIKASDDIQAPTVVSISPVDGAKVTANTEISAVIYDNYKLNRVIFEYQAQGEEEWHVAETIMTTAKSGVFSFTWKNEELPSGNYKMHCYAIDAVGNKSEGITVSYELKTEVLAAPILHAEPGPWQVKLDWSINEEESVSYKIYRKYGNSDFKLIAQTDELTYTEECISPKNIYTYKVIASDIYGRSSESNEIQAIPSAEDPYAPTAKLCYSVTTITDAPVIFDGSASSDNDEIVGYRWNFGDGETGIGVNPKHTYTKEGVYNVSLTVEDAYGNTDSTEMNVYVYSKTLSGKLELTVLDSETGLPIPNALVYIDVPSTSVQSNPIVQTDDKGIAHIYQGDGNYDICAYASGYLPHEDNFKITKGYENSAIISLTPGEPVVGDIDVHKMTIEEMLQYEIDLSDPKNYQTYSFRLRLTFMEEDLICICNSYGDFVHTPVTNDPGGSDIDCKATKVTIPHESGGKAYRTYIQPVKGETETPAISILDVPQEVTWLKDFFDISLTITNVCDEQFVIEDSALRLELPQGLSLASVASDEFIQLDANGNQKSEIYLDDLAGGEQFEYKWFVRGDNIGEYTIDVDYSGRLMPFQTLINSIFQNKDPIKVSGGNCVSVVIQLEDAAYSGESYYIYYQITNISGQPLYNFTWSTGSEVGEYCGGGTTGGFCDLGDAPKFPGEELDQVNNPIECEEDDAISVDSVHIPDLDIHDFGEDDNIVETKESITVDSFEPGESIYLVYHASVNCPPNKKQKLIKSEITENHGNIPVSISVIPAHAPKYNIIEPQLVEDPVNIVTGAQETSKKLMSLQGLGEVTFEAYYSSLTPEEHGENETPERLGYGWYHNYEMKLEQIKDVQGILVLHLSPVNVLLLYDKNGNGVYTSYNKELADIKCVDLGGEYVFTDSSDQEYTFDSKGLLVKIHPKGGSIIELHYTDKLLTSISERNSDVFMQLNYNDENLITSVIDQMGRKVSFEYNGNHQLIGITDLNGNTETYTYSGTYQIETMTNGDGITYLTNTYDSEGRVITQDDSRSDNQIVQFTYDESNFWRKLITVKDRMGHSKLYVYNRNGNLIMTQEQVDDQKTKLIKMTYDERGNKVTETNGDVEVEYEYNNNNQLIKTIYPENMISSMSYDSNGYITSVATENSGTTYFTNNENGKVTTMVTPSGQTVNYEYDDYSRILSEETVGLGTIHYEYSGGRLSSISDHKGNKSYVSYDEVLSDTLF